MALTTAEQKLVNNAMVVAHALRNGRSIEVDSKEARQLVAAAEAVATQNSTTLQNGATAGVTNL